MVQLVDDLDLLDEVRDVLVAEPSLFYVLLDRDLLAVEFAQEDLPVAAFADGLHGFDLVLADQEGQLDPLLLEVL